MGHDPGVDEPGQIRRARTLSNEPAVYRGRTRRAGLCDGSDERKEGRSRCFWTDVSFLFGPGNLRNCVASGQRTPLQHHEHRPKYPLGHAVRHGKEERVAEGSSRTSCQLPYSELSRSWTVGKWKTAVIPATESSVYKG